MNNSREKSKINIAVIINRFLKCIYGYIYYSNGKINIINLLKVYFVLFAFMSFICFIYFIYLSFFLGFITI